MAKSKRSQADKFADAAREVEASDKAADFDRMLSGIAKAPPPSSVQKRKTVHASDCAIHNAPAYKAGACDCGAED